jgi:SagB-type dehydrogenase family enzyme
MLDAIPAIQDFLTNPRFVERQNRGYKTYPNARQLRLQEPVAQARDLQQALQARRSTRAFEPRAVSMQQIGDLLHLALRSSRRSRVDPRLGSSEIWHRPYPSGGALYPIEHYLIALNIEGLAPCVAHYDPRGHALEIVREDMQPEELFMAMPNGGSGTRAAAAAIVSTAVFVRSVAKYGGRGYRFALLEAGCAAQNLALAATSSGLETVFWGGYYDDAINDLCGADSVTESVVSMMFLGHADGAADDAAKKPTL